MATEKRERQKAARRQKMERLQREAQRRRTVRRGVIVAIIAVVVIGTAALLFSGNGTPTSVTTSSTTSTSPVSHAQAVANAKAVAAGCPARTTDRANTLTWKSSPPMQVNTHADYYAHVTTTAGAFEIQLLTSKAPITVNNFVYLARHKFYNCVTFHRVIPGFVVQGGDPTGSGSGGPGYTIADEFPKAGKPTYPLYSVAMANTGAANSGGSQFFIVTGTSGEALPPKYSLFGQVVSGQSVVKTIQDEGSASGAPTVIERMLSVTITTTK